MRLTPNGFKIATAVMALVLGWFAIYTILAEALAPRVPLSSRDNAPAAPVSSEALADWTATAVLRGDLVARIASARAAAALNGSEAPDTPDAAATRDSALAIARRSLSLAPHASAMWLQVAMLQSQTKTDASGAAGLKMSYLTAANDMKLIPTRLAMVARSTALDDDELRDLARGDIRLILSRRPDQKAAIVNAHRGGSPDGKTYIEDVVRSIDPRFSASLP